METKVKLVKIPKRCPACGETSKWAFGPPSVFVIEDEQIPSKWVVVAGWGCKKPDREEAELIFGTAVRRGPVEEEGETVPLDIWEEDVVYIISTKIWPGARTALPGRKCRCEGRYYTSSAINSLY